MIEIRDITVQLGGSQILSRVSARFEPGQLVAVLGPNGAGKSTLLRAMCADVPLSAGCVRFDGLCVRKWPAKKLALRRAVMPQHVTLAFPFTVREVASLGRIPHESIARRSENERAVDEAMRTAEVDHLAGRLYPTLSGGEQQRVQLARALAQLDMASSEAPDGGPPRYLWLDEPTSGLDLAHQHRLMQVARDTARRGLGVFCILHDLNLAAAYADRVLLLSGGKVAGWGHPSQVLQSDLIRSVYGIDVIVRQHPSTAVPVVFAAPVSGGTG